MTDRELLELAAKPAGIKYESSTNAGLYLGGNEDNFWQPLNDDGDALRLAVKLRLNVEIYEDLSISSDRHDIDIKEDHSENPLAATRRAIVRAAAEIGKGMK